MSSSNHFRNNICKEKLSKSLKEENISIRTILSQARLVHDFSLVIEDHLWKDVSKLTEILIEKYEIEESLFTQNNIIELPRSFSVENSKLLSVIDQFFQEYIKSLREVDTDKLIYLERIIYAKNLNLKPETRYLAKKKYEKILKNTNVSSISYPVSVNFDYVDPSPRINHKDFKISFDLRWLEEHKDFKTRFIYNLNDFLEIMPLGTFGVYPSQPDPSLIDILTVKGVGDYEKNIFASPFFINLYTIMLYQAFLKENKSSLEDLLEYFYNHYFPLEFGMESFDVNIQSDSNFFQSKIKNFIPEFDLSLQKINFYSKYGYLDLEFIHFDNTAINYDQIKSFSTIKHIYLNEKASFSPFYLLNFEKFSINIDGEYLSPYDAITSKKIVYDSLDLRSKKIIDWFRRKNIIENKGSHLIFSDPIKTEIYRHLYLYDVIIYPEVNEKAHQAIKEEIKRKYLYYDNKLLSRYERNHLSYLLDDKKYTNGFKLRNKYTHKGKVKHQDDEKTHYTNYYIFLMLFIQITLKFNNDLCHQYHNQTI